MFKILITEKALKDLKNPDAETRKRVLEMLKYLSKDPIAYQGNL
jgi:mRNA-degrading endonuclease RelE of RelBE toxin-antitoxin system